VFKKAIRKLFATKMLTGARKMHKGVRSPGYTLHVREYLVAIARKQLDAEASANVPEMVTTKRILDREKRVASECKMARKC
jgi:hypothetical protein